MGRGTAYVTSLFPDTLLINLFSVFAGSSSSCSLNVIIRIVTLMEHSFYNLQAWYHLIIKPLIRWTNIGHLPHIWHCFWLYNTKMERHKLDHSVSLWPRTGVPSSWATDRCQSVPIRNRAAQQEVNLNAICLNHPKLSPPPCHHSWKNCLPLNQSLVTKRLGTAGNNLET